MSNYTPQTILLCLVSCPPLLAGGPVQSLPEDGSWVRFHLEIETSGPDGVSGEHTGSWTVRSVGTRTVRGTKCRWIEIEEHVDEADDGKPFTSWFKFLVPEEDLRPGGDPVRNLVEYWWEDSRNPRVPTKRDEPSAMLPMFLRGTPRTKTVVAEPRRVLWQRGDFTVARAEEQTQTIGTPEKLVVRDVVWRRADVPFGTAVIHSSVRLERKGFPTYTYLRRLSLADHGTGAKSRIPQAE